MNHHALPIPLLTLPLLLTACSTRTANDRLISLRSSIDEFSVTSIVHFAQDDFPRWHDIMQQQREIQIAGLDRLINSQRSFAESHRLRYTRMSNAYTEGDGFAEARARAYERTAEAYADYRDALDRAYADLLAADPDQIRATTLTRSTDGDLTATPGPVADFLDALQRARENAGPFIPPAARRRH